MGYLHIPNLYRPEGQLILAMKECYALEKLHGTSADVTWKSNPSNKSQRQLIFHSGGESHSKFVSIFDTAKLTTALTELGIDPDKDLTIYGEAYAGSCQKMGESYGKQLKFAVFDIQIGDTWLAVPQAEELTKQLGLEFVYYEKVSTDLASLDAQRDMPSVQAIRNGVSSIVGHNVLEVGEKDNVIDHPKLGRILNPKKREGVVLRPLFEIRLNDHAECGNRLICKHKGDDFRETASPRVVEDPTKLKVLADADGVANEWVTATRLEHVLQKLINVPHDMSLIPKLIPAMIEDVYREGKGEFTESEAVKKSIGKKTVEIFKNYLKSQITQ